MLRVVLCFSFILASQFSFALSPFEKHFLSVSQSMSDFYMFLLSEEDSRFLATFEQHSNEATKALFNTNDAQEKALLNKWVNLLPLLQYEQVKGMGSTIAQKIRFDFRAYLVDLYLHYEQQQTTTGQGQAAYKRIQLYTAMLVARSMDVDSSIYGVNNFTDHDRLLDQAKVADTIDQDLEFLLESKLPKNFLVDLRRVSAKFKFMKPSLVNYKTRSAIFLSYQNAHAINDLLDAQLKNGTVIANLN